MAKKLIAIIIALCLFAQQSEATLLCQVTAIKESALRPAAMATCPSTRAEQSENQGPLDNVTILRFAHGYEGAGGVEQHLKQLNKALLERSKVTIIQMYCTKDKDKLEISSESIGKGTLIRVPILAKRGMQRGSLGLSGKYLKIYKKLAVLLTRLGFASFILRYVLNSRISVFLKMIPLIKEFYNREMNPDEVRNKARDILSKYKIDLVMIHSLFINDPFALIEEVKRVRENKGRNIPIILQHHGNNSYFRNINFRKLIKMADAVASVSINQLPSNIIEETEVVRNGLDTDFFSSEKAKGLVSDYTEPVILLPALVVPLKGHMDLIRIISRVLRNKKVKKVKVIFAGPVVSTDFKDKILNLARKNKVPEKDIIFTGSLSQEELREYYAVSDIVVLPSVIEGLPRVLLEAQAMQKVVLAYNTGGVSEAMVYGKTGYYFRRGSVRKFAKKLEMLLLDENKRTTMSKAGREFVKGFFSLKHLASRHEGFYTRILAGKRISQLPGKRINSIGAKVGRLVAVILSPIVLLVILILIPFIKLSSKGPILIVQTRVGYKGKMIRVPKLRTMREGGEDEEIRMTKVGRVIRKLGLDEIPQIFSIIKGDMQWFGPRPLLSSMVTNEYITKVLSRTKPGVFSKSASYRQIGGMKKVLDSKDIEYCLQDIENSSFIYNSKIFVRNMSEVWRNLLSAIKRRYFKSDRGKSVAHDKKADGDGETTTRVKVGTPAIVSDLLGMSKSSRLKLGTMGEHDRISTKILSAA